MPDTVSFTANELLTVMSSRQLRDGQVVFAGVGIPLLAATLAQGLHCPGLTILFEGGVIGPMIEPGKLPPSTNEQRCTKRANMVLGSTDVLLLLQRGYVDVGFMVGAQIDQFGKAGDDAFVEAEADGEILQVGRRRHHHGIGRAVVCQGDRCFLGNGTLCLRRPRPAPRRCGDATSWSRQAHSAAPTGCAMRPCACAVSR